MEFRCAVADVEILSVTGSCAWASLVVGVVPSSSAYGGIAIAVAR